MDDVAVISFDDHKARSWQKQCQSNSKGILLPNLHNAMIALRSDGDVRDAFGFDEMQRAAVALHEVGQPLEQVDRWVTDNDTRILCVWLQRNGFPTMGLEIAYAALMQRAHEVIQ